MTRQKILKMLFLLTSADFLTKQSHWGSILEDLGTKSECFLLTDRTVSVRNTHSRTIVGREILTREGMMRYLLVFPLMIVRGIASARRADIVATPSGGPSQFAGFFLGRLVRRPFVIYLRTDPRLWRMFGRQSLFSYAVRTIHERFLLITLRAANAIIAISPYEYALAKYLSISARKLHLIYLGVDTTESFPYCYQVRKGGPYVVGFLGRFSHENGCDVLIQTALLNPEIGFLVVGDSPDAKLELPPNLTFTGFVSHDQVWRYLSKMDLLLSPKLATGIPVAVMESLSCGVPVVGTNLPSLRSTKCAAVAPSASPGAISELLRSILPDEERRKSMSLEARKLAESTFDLRVCNKDFVEMAWKVCAAYTDRKHIGKT